eukprot:m.3463 g.3463  ORF g.3463 m.3463 type:complete len:1132 (-) comp2775_c0_seq1:65-3460(-)
MSNLGGALQLAASTAAGFAALYLLSPKKDQQEHTKRETHEPNTEKPKPLDLDDDDAKKEPKTDKPLEDSNSVSGESVSDGVNHTPHHEEPEQVQNDTSRKTPCYRETGLYAAAHIAYKFSDMIFVYNTGDSGALKHTLETLVLNGRQNVMGRVPMIEVVQTRQGAGAMAAGALSQGPRVTVVASSQSIPLMIPNMMRMSAARQPCVFHIAAQVINDELAISSDLSGVMAARDTGFSIIAAYSVQEISDMALVTQATSAMSSLPTINVFDGADLARASAHVRCTESLQIPESFSELTSLSPVDAFDVSFDKLEPNLHRKYKFFEYYGGEHATHVAVVFGSGAEVFKQVVESLNSANQAKPFGVVIVRVFRPWVSERFVEALPGTTRRICATAVSSSSDAVGPILADVFSSLGHDTSRKSRPLVLSSLIVPESRGCCREKVTELFRNLADPHPCKIFTVDDAKARETVMPPPAPRPNTQKSLCVLGADKVSKIIDNVHLLLADGNGLHSYTRVDQDAYHPSHPTRALATVSRIPEEASSYSACCDLFVVADCSVLSSHGAELVSALDSCPGSILAIAKESHVNVSKCVEELLSHIHHQISVVAIDATEIASEIGISEEQALAVAVCSILSHNAPALHISLNKASQLLGLSYAAAKHVTESAARSIKDITTEISALDADPSNQDDTTVHVTTSEISSLVPRITPVKTELDGATQSQLVQTHRVAWNLLFNNDMECDEVFRPYERTTVYQVKLTKFERLTPDEYDRNVFHLEFDTSGTGLEYGIGDALGVYGHNDPSEVQRFLNWYGLNGGDFIALAPEEGMESDKEELLTVQQVFIQRLDLFGKPSQAFYAALEQHATDVYQRKKLKWLGSEDREGFRLRQLEAYTFADVLEEFKSAHPSLTELVELIPPIKPRHYSISSSMKLRPNSVHLLVVAVEWSTPKGRKRTGQCTRYLASLRPDLEDIYVAVDIMPSVMKLPKDPKQPVIGAALGTGLAPFRAFVEERTYLKEQGVELGPMVLYFGARYRAQEFLYGDDLEEAEREGVITDLRLAFSRDTKKKVYIQHKILEDKDKLSSYFLQDGGHFYLCGPTWPVPEVKKALCDGFLGSGEVQTYDEAEEYIENLKRQGRYILEVY